MYYPYLRGRQFELIALREFALQRGDNNNITPIIEPVKKTFNSLKLALPKLFDGKVKFALILNPQVGDFTNKQDDAKVHSIMESLRAELADRSKWIPAFILNNNYSDVLTQIKKGGLSDIMVICSDITDTGSIAFDSLVSSQDVKYIVSKENRTLKRKLTGKNKTLIRLDDNFIAQKRNSDYLTIQEEKFTEEHLFYKNDSYQGFSDYTGLMSEFTEGGSIPRAVVIHLTYEKENEEVWIRHFTSDTNGDVSNVQGKFAEAAEKAVFFLNEKKIHNYASEELRKYYDEGTYPGLGMVKKISIKNHLELINKLLTSK